MRRLHHTRCDWHLTPIQIMTQTIAKKEFPWYPSILRQFNIVMFAQRFTPDRCATTSGTITWLSWNNISPCSFSFPQPEKGGHEPRFVYIETIFLPHCDTSIRAVFRASLGSSRSVVGRCLVPPSPVYLLTRDRRRAAWNRVIEPPSYIPVITINSKSKRYTANCPTLSPE
jgi:hypothetical protein